MQTKIQKNKEKLEAYIEAISKSKVFLIFAQQHYSTIFSKKKKKGNIHHNITVIVFNLQNKQEKLQLTKNYNRLQKQKEELEDSLKNTTSPNEQREQLLQQVRIETFPFNQSNQSVLCSR